MTQPLRRAGIPYQPEAVDNLLKAANGNPSRLRDLADNAVRLAQPPYGITADVAKHATAQVNDRSRVFYQAAWNNCSDAEKDLLAKVAVRGPRGLAMPTETQAATSGRWQEVDNARQGLVARGMLRESGQRVNLADPGLQEWVETRVGQSAAHAGVALPGTPAPAINQPLGTRRRSTHCRSGHRPPPSDQHHGHPPGRQHDLHHQHLVPRPAWISWSDGVTRDRSGIKKHGWRSRD